MKGNQSSCLQYHSTASKVLQLKRHSSLLLHDPITVSHLLIPFSYSWNMRMDSILPLSIQTKSLPVNVTSSSTPPHDSSASSTKLRKEVRSWSTHVIPPHQGALLMPFHRYSSLCRPVASTHVFFIHLGRPSVITGSNHSCSRQKWVLR